MNLFHITTFEKPRQTLLIPRVPEESMSTENITIERVSFSDSISGCIFGLGNSDKINVGDQIRVYRIDILENDDSLYLPHELYYNGWVNDATLSNEYWYTQPIIPSDYYEYEVKELKTKRFIVVAASEIETVKNFLESEKILIPGDADICHFINDSLNIDQKIRLKKYLTEEKEENKSTEDVYYKIFGEKRKKTSEDFEYKYDEFTYISDCILEKI